MSNQNNIEQISLDISNYWSSNDFLTESNKKCGTLVAFDWTDGYLNEINTNVDMGDSELENFKFDVFIEFLKNNNFTFVLGLRNVAYSEINPSEEWTNKLKEMLKSNEIGYDEYMIDSWPAPIPEFDIPDNIFVLRYSYDEYSKLDKLASNNLLFKNWIEKSDWEQCYKYLDGDLDSKLQSLTKSDVHRRDELKFDEKTRVIVFFSDIENFVLHEGYNK